MILRTSSSLELWIQELLRARGIHVLFRDEIRAGVDRFRDLLALGGGKRGLDAVITHTVRILHHQRRDRAVFQQLDEFVVRVEADQFDFICRPCFRRSPVLRPAP